MSTHVSLRGIAVRTISHSCFNQEEDFPATSKQMTDHRPEGSVSTAPGGNGGISEEDSGAKVSIILFSSVIPTRRQSWSAMMSTEKAKPPLLQKKLWPAGARPSSLRSVSYISKDCCERISARISSPLSSFSPSPCQWIGFSHSTGTWITAISLGCWEYPLALTHLLLADSPARRSTNRTDGDDGER